VCRRVVLYSGDCPIPVDLTLSAAAAAAVVVHDDSLPSEQLSVAADVAWKASEARHHSE